MVKKEKKINTKNSSSNVRQSWSTQELPRIKYSFSKVVADMTVESIVFEASGWNMEEVNAGLQLVWGLHQAYVKLKDTKNGDKN